DLANRRSRCGIRSELPPAPTLADAAYIFFTSGTTGIPKGILGDHQGLAHFIDWERKELQIGANDRVAQIASLSFDAMLKDIFPALTAGSALVIPPFVPFDDPLRLVRWFEEQEISVAQTVPSVFASWTTVSSARLPSLRSLRVVTLAGEPL